MIYLNLVIRFILMFGYLRSGLRLLWRLRGASRVPFWVKLLLPLGLLYLILPRDLVPDFVPGVGLLDDALILGTVLFTLYRLRSRLIPGRETGGDVQDPRRKDAIEGDYKVLEDEGETQGP